MGYSHSSMIRSESEVGVRRSKALGKKASPGIGFINQTDCLRLIQLLYKLLSFVEANTDMLIQWCPSL